MPANLDLGLLAWVSNHIPETSLFVLVLLLKVVCVVVRIWRGEETTLYYYIRLEDFFTNLMV